MSESNRKLHYKVLGRKLQLLREKMHESLLEVSAAVEIEPAELIQIEKGEQQPSEDILLLLLSHFDPQDDEAVKIWELAGYSQASLPISPVDESTSKPIVMILGNDSRVLYTDQFDVVANQNGVVLNFSQSQGTEVPSTISRLGMSRQQAQHLMVALHQSLNQKAPAQRLLPPSGRQPKD